LNILQIFILVLIGVVLLWFGYRLFFRMPNAKNRPQRSTVPGGVGGQAGDPQTCPVCAAKLPPGMLVKSAAFPTLNGKDRLMHIMGCPFCLEGPIPQRRPRVCPVCHKPIDDRGFLFARIFERPKKTHVHVLGCMNCRGSRAMR
jgi:hypothetical protein